MVLNGKTKCLVCVSYAQACSGRFHDDDAETEIVK